MRRMTIEGREKKVQKRVKYGGRGGEGRIKRGIRD